MNFLSLKFVGIYAGAWVVQQVVYGQLIHDRWVAFVQKQGW